MSLCLFSISCSVDTGLLNLHSVKNKTCYSHNTGMLLFPRIRAHCNWYRKQLGVKYLAYVALLPNHCTQPALPQLLQSVSHSSILLQSPQSKKKDLHTAWNQEETCQLGRNDHLGVSLECICFLRHLYNFIFFLFCMILIMVKVMSRCMLNTYSASVLDCHAHRLLVLLSFSFFVCQVILIRVVIS